MIMTAISKFTNPHAILSELSMTRESALKIGVGLVGFLGLSYLVYSKCFDSCGCSHSTTADRRKSTHQSYPLLDQIPELNSPNVHIKDKDRVELILSNIKKAGKHSLQVVSDFDRTISLCSYQGQSCPTSFGILQHSPLVDPQLSGKLNELFDHYYPIEHDHSLTKEEKTPFMVEWWEKANQIIVDTGFTRQQLREIIQNSMTHLKHNCKLFFKRLEDNNIPCLVFSAGLGDVIEEWMEHECNGSYRNIKIVSNFMDFDPESGRIRGFKGQMIHVYNKNEGVLLDTEYEKDIHTRPNVILLGDSLGDTEMANGFPSLNNILKIGFLNLKVDVLLPQYVDAFDIVLVQDDSFDIPNVLLKHLF